MFKRMRAKLLLATAHRDIGDEEDVIVIRRGSIGSECYSTLANEDTVRLLTDVGVALCESNLQGKPHA